MRARWPDALALLALTALALGRLATAAEAPARPEPPSRLLVFHWWRLPAETEALKSLLDRFSARYPGVSASEQLVPGGGGNQRSLFSIVTKLVAGQRAPEALQSHAGYAAQPLVEAGLLSPIDALWESEGLVKVMPPVIRSMTNINGHYYCVPIGVHRLNVVWYNKALLDRKNIDPASLTTWEAFFKAADQLRAGGVATPIQMGETWTGSAVFQGIMASLGIDIYEDWINGRLRAPDDPNLRRAFETLGEYLSYVNTDHAGLKWDQALQRVITGDSAFYTMGDWSDGEFRIAGKKYGKDYGAIPVPGTKDMYGVAIDTFVQLKSPASPLSSDRWLKLVASREAQDSFNVIKGSIPARSDPEVARYAPYQKAAILDLKSARYVYPNGDEAMPPGYRTSLDDTIDGFVMDRDAKKATRRLAEAASRLAGKYTRSWSLK